MIIYVKIEIIVTTAILSLIYQAKNIIMFQLVKIIDSSAPHQGDIRCCKKNGGEAGINKVVLLLFTFIFSTALFSYAQSPVPHDEPVNEYYNEVLQFQTA